MTRHQSARRVSASQRGPGDAEAPEHLVQEAVLGSKIHSQTMPMATTDVTAGR